MFLFILGIVTGLGLGQLVVHAEGAWHARLNRKQAEFDIAVAQAIANANPLPDGWESCGCHPTWEAHEAFMLQGTSKTKGEYTHPSRAIPFHW